MYSRINPIIIATSIASLLLSVSNLGAFNMLNLPDSTITKLETFSSRAAKLEYLLSQAKAFRNANPPLAMTFVEVGVNMSLKTPHEVLLARAFLLRAELVIRENRNQIKALQCYPSLLIALNIFRENKEWLLQAKTNNLLAYLEIKKGEYESAKHFIAEAETCFQSGPKQRQDSTILGDTYFNRADVFHNEGKSDSANYYIKKTSLAYQAAGDLEKEAILGLNRAIIAPEDQNLSLLFEEVIKQFHSLGNKVFEKNTRIRYANHLLRKASYAKDLNPNDSVADRLLSEVKAQLLKGRSSPEDLDCEWCLLYGGFYLANYMDSTEIVVQYYLKGLQLAANNGERICLQKSMEALNLILTPFDTSTIIIINSLSIALEQYSNVIQNVIEKHQQEFHLYWEWKEEQENRFKSRSNLFILSSIFLSIISVGFGGYYNFRNRKLVQLNKAQEDTIKAERAAANAQMNPHFMSNALTAIKHLVDQENKLEASKYLTQFAHLNDLVLEHSKRELITLEKELMVAQLYLDLEKLRFGGRLSYQIKHDLGDIFHPQDLIVPPNFIQPHLENAVVNGIKNKKTPGIVTLNIKLQEDTLQVLIEDDGVGRKKAKSIQQKPDRPRESLGIRINTDLLQSFGGELEISDLNEDREETGTQVSITLPLKLKYENQNNHS